MKQIVDASICEPSQGAPDLIETGARTWLTRGATFVIAISEAEPGAVLTRAANDDEYMLFVSTGMSGRVEAGDEAVGFNGRCDTLCVVPPGASRVVLDKAGVVTRIFTQRASDLLAMAGNAAKYAGEPVDDSPAPPPPPGGFRVRVYPLDDHIKPDSPARPFRSTNMLVNAFVPRDFRRDTRKMTPHAHAEFDQASLALQGGFVHHLRYPWIPDMTQWREDQHLPVGSPSVIVIPAKAEHTTQDVGTGWCQLVDIFSPARPDFVERPGWVCNEADYPLHVDQSA